MAGKFFLFETQGWRIRNNIVKGHEPWFFTDVFGGMLMSRAMNSVVWFEGLEGRRFLSATPAAIHAAEATSITAAPHVPVADDAQLVGDWKGKLKAKIAGIAQKSF